MSTDLPPLASDEEFNPYAPPTADIGEAPIDQIPAGDLAAAEAIRRTHIGHEAAIKSIGSLHFLGAIFGLLGTGFVIYANLASWPADDPNTHRLMIGVVGVLYLLLSGLHLALGIGLTRLQNWARWTDVVLISLSMLMIVIQIGVAAFMNEIPTMIGTLIAALIPGYMLYLLVSSKASMIFSPEYKTIIAQTPHIKYRTSLVLKFFLVVIVALIVFAVVAAIFGSEL